MLVGDQLTRPKPIARTPLAQKAVDAATEFMALYHFQGCPFCIKTRRVIRRLNLNIELKDAKNDATHRETLMRRGGYIRVPCLRIKDGSQSEQWMYESNDIINYLESRFG